MFRKRLMKCFSIGYSESLGIQEIVDKLLELTKVDVRLINETNNTAEYAIYKISGPKFITVLFSTDLDGTMSVTEIDDDGFPFATINAVGGNYNDMLSKVKEIINRRTKN